MVLIFAIFSVPLVFAGESDMKSSAVTVEYGYTGEEFGNLSGGRKKGDQYRGNFDLTLMVDTEKSGLWKGGLFCVYLQNGHGHGISERYVGDLQVLSNIDAREFTQVSEYYVGQSFMDGRLRFKAGKQDANVDFNVADTAAEFINSSFGLMPNVPIPTFPDPALGIMGSFAATERIAVQAGVFDGCGCGGSWGFSTAFGSDPASVAVGELHLRLGLPGAGRAKVGVWRKGGEALSLDGTATRPYNYGGYVILEEDLVGSVDRVDEPGLSMFVQYGAAPEKYNAVREYVGIGLRAAGFFPVRPEDSFGAGMARAVFGGDLPGMMDETAYELYYLAPIRDVFAVQPDVQYIVSPGGTGKDALVAGVRVYVTF